MTSPWAQLLAGQTLGGYRLGDFISSGAFGVVFEVKKADTKARFAMKVLPPVQDAQALLDFDNEGVLLKKLTRCSSVINLVESGVETVQMTISGGVVAPIALKYHVLSLASGSLEELIISPDLLADLAWPERIAIWRGAIKGVHQMHLKSVAHRDIKSSNCLLMIAGTRSEVRLADLGRSKDLVLPPMHQAGLYVAGLGDMRFAPPEYRTLQGGATPLDFKNADLYGLGSLLVELATGHPMTALAMGTWADTGNQAIADYKAGVTHDLSTLRPQFRAAIDGISEQFPSRIRYEGTRLLIQLCDPVPQARQPIRAPGRRWVPDNGLLWLLRRADILVHQLAIAPRRTRYKSQTAERSA